MNIDMGMCKNCGALCHRDKIWREPDRCEECEDVVLAKKSKVTNRTPGELADALDDYRFGTLRKSMKAKSHKAADLLVEVSTALREMEGTRIEGWVDTIAFVKDPVIRFLRDDPKDTQTVPAILILTDPREKNDEHGEKAEEEHYDGLADRRSL